MHANFKTLVPDAIDPPVHVVYPLNKSENIALVSFQELEKSPGNLQEANDTALRVKNNIMRP